MASKRGRPILEDDRDAATELRRMRTRERMRQLRQRQREANNSTLARSTEQLAQGEQIINFTTSTEEDAAATLLQLGLRVQDLTLPQNPAEADLQRDAVDADEHHELYPNIEKAQDDVRESQRRVHPGFFRQFARRHLKNKNKKGLHRVRPRLHDTFPHSQQRIVRRTRRHDV